MLEINNLSLGYGQQNVLQNISIELEQGEIGCFLGPSGCGKTTLLRAIAGFKSVQGGSINVDGRVVSNAEKQLPAAQRKIGVVFQDFALFPHMSVLKNVAYGLSKLAKAESLKLAQEAISLVGLSEVQNKYPHELSGGQQQRVAIARALAPRPNLLLLDEPFSSLDPDLRERLSSEIRDIIKKQNITALLITHDQTEAFAMADKIGVLHDQECKQWGTAYDLYHEPATEFIADFVGEGVFIPAKIVAYENDDDKSIEPSSDKQWWLETQLGRFLLPEEYLNRKGFALGDTVKMLVRPDDLRHQDESVLKASVVGRSFRGAHILYALKLDEGDDKLLCLAPSHHDHKLGESFGIHLEVEHVICFAMVN
jgi:iron(III) transport system ATP-binding protein